MAVGIRLPQRRGRGQILVIQGSSPEHARRDNELRYLSQFYLL
jgi:hypothetical protein